MCGGGGGSVRVCASVCACVMFYGRYREEERSWKDHFTGLNEETCLTPTAIKTNGASQSVRACDAHACAPLIKLIKRCRRVCGIINVSQGVASEINGRRKTNTKRVKTNPKITKQNKN